ncbi:MAG: Uma2 family endonuclease, partial [Moorea sp. SIO1F2]|nr:Uma2 family endonuclease [Moorena sp. SIO1F2]
DSPNPASGGWVSPRLGITFELVASQLVLYYPNGEPFASYLEISEQRDMAQQQAELERLAKEQERQRAEQAQEALELERLEKQQASQRAELERLEKEQERQRAEQAEQALELERIRMKALLEQLKAKGINPEDFNL